MACRFLGVAVMVCAVVSCIFAQDPTKVEPKHYRLLFENDRVQVVSVHYGPHEKSEMHEHPGGVVVIVTGGHLKFTDQSGKITDVYAKPGEARWFPPFRHRVENVGDEPYNAVYVGIKNRATDARLAGAAAAESGAGLDEGSLDEGSLDERSSVSRQELAGILALYAAAAGKP